MGCSAFRRLEQSALTEEVVEGLGEHLRSVGAGCTEGLRKGGVAGDVGEEEGCVGVRCEVWLEFEGGGGDVVDDEVGLENEEKVNEAVDKGVVLVSRLPQRLVLVLKPLNFLATFGHLVRKLRVVLHSLLHFLLFLHGLQLGVEDVVRFAVGQLGGVARGRRDAVCTTVLLAC